MAHRKFKSLDKLMEEQELARSANIVLKAHLEVGGL